jgi:hypothetical protein
MTPHKACHRVPGSRDSGQRKAEDVGRDASTAGVAADGGRRGALAVLSGCLGHEASPNLLHGLILGGFRETLSQIASKDEGEVQNEQGDGYIVGHGCPTCSREQLICSSERGTRRSGVPACRGVLASRWPEGETGQPWERRHDSAGVAMAGSSGRVETQENGTTRINRAPARGWSRPARAER